MLLDNSSRLSRVNLLFGSKCDTIQQVGKQTSSIQLIGNVIFQDLSNVKIYIVEYHQHL